MFPVVFGNYFFHSCEAIVAIFQSFLLICALRRDGFFFVQSVDDCSFFGQNLPKVVPVSDLFRLCPPPPQLSGRILFALPRRTCHINT